jgi:carbon monoxide dehydrogenase subunit G
VKPQSATFVPRRRHAFANRPELFREARSAPLRRIAGILSERHRTSEATLEIHGEHLIHATRDHVWHLLNDPSVLARITPGVTNLIPDGDDRYKATIKVAIGPVKGAFQGQIEVTDKRPPEAMTLKLSARGPGGGVAAVGRITLHEVKTESDATRVTWSGEPQLMGLLATVGSRFVEGAAKSHADEFFIQLEREATSA